MRFYHQGYREVLSLPLRFFWGLNAKIARLRAEEQLGLVDLTLLGGMNASGEMIEEFLSARKDTMGTPMVVIEEIPHDQHLEGIKKLAGMNAAILEEK